MNAGALGFSEADRRTANGDETSYNPRTRQYTFLTPHWLIHAPDPPKELFSQHTVCAELRTNTGGVSVCVRVRLLTDQTWETYQALPEPTPTTLMGEQVRPMRPVRSPSTMPRRPARRFPSAEVLCRALSADALPPYPGTYGDRRVAALHAAGAAGALADLEGRGDRKKREGKEGGGGELHCEGEGCFGR